MPFEITSDDDDLALEAAETRDRMREWDAMTPQEQAQALAEAEAAEPAGSVTADVPRDT